MERLEVRAGIIILGKVKEPQEEEVCPHREKGRKEEEQENVKISRCVEPEADGVWISGYLLDMLGSGP